MAQCIAQILNCVTFPGSECVDPHACLLRNFPECFPVKNLGLDNLSLLDRQHPNCGMQRTNKILPDPGIERVQARPRNYKIYCFLGNIGFPGVPGNLLMSPGIYYPAAEQRIEPGSQVPNFVENRKAFQSLNVDVMKKILRLFQCLPGGAQPRQKFGPLRPVR